MDHIARTFVYIHSVLLKALFLLNAATIKL